MGFKKGHKPAKAKKHADGEMGGGGKREMRGESGMGKGMQPPTWDEKRDAGLAKGK